MKKLLACLFFITALISHATEYSRTNGVVQIQTESPYNDEVILKSNIPAVFVRANDFSYCALIIEEREYNCSSDLKPALNASNYRIDGEDYYVHHFSRSTIESILIDFNLLNDDEPILSLGKLNPDYTYYSGNYVRSSDESFEGLFYVSQRHNFRYNSYRIQAHTTSNKSFHLDFKITD